MRRPRHDGQQAKNPVEIDGVRCDEAVGEKVESKVGVGDRLGGSIEIDDDPNAYAVGARYLVVAFEVLDSLGQDVGVKFAAGLAEGRLRKPRVEYGAVSINGL